MSLAIRVELPAGLSHLARAPREISLLCESPVTQRRVLDALETRYPMLRGTVRDAATARRRPFIRFFACRQDLSHTTPDEPLPEAVVTGDEMFMIVGAIAGG